jgi:hypothetical protein
MYFGLHNFKEQKVFVALIVIVFWNSQKIFVNSRDFLLTTKVFRYFAKSKFRKIQHF